MTDGYKHNMEYNTGYYVTILLIFYKKTLLCKTRVLYSLLQVISLNDSTQ